MLVMILVVASPQRGVVSLGFQMDAFPVMKAREKFQPKTYATWTEFSWVL